MRKSLLLGVIDQAVLSLFNMAVSFALIAYATPMEFGRYVYALTVILILTSLHNALISTPLSVLIPARTGALRMRTVDDLVSFDLLLRMAGVVVALAFFIIAHRDPSFILAGLAGAYLTLGRERARSLFIATDRVERCLVLDLVFAVSAVAFTVILWGTLAPSTATLSAIALANALALLLTTLGETRPVNPITGGAAVAQTYWREHWRDTRWSLAGASVTEAHNRAYVVVLEVLRDAAAVASVQAGRLLLGPLVLLASAWVRIARPAFAGLLARDERDAAWRLLWQGLSLVSLLAFAYAMALVLAWPLAETYVFKGRYADIAVVTALWGIYTGLALARIMLSTVLQAAYRLRALAYASMAAAMVSALLLLALLLEVPAWAAIIAVIAGEAVLLMWIGILVAKLFRDPQPLSARARGTAE